MDFFSAHKSQIEKYLTQSQILTMQLLIWLLQVQKEVRIERLASCLPIPILYESRRKKIQRFLVLSSLSLPLFWFPIIKSIVEKEFKLLERLILVLDRTQWYEIVIIGDREFHGVELSYWLKQKNKQAKKPIYFAFREKDNIYINRSKTNPERLKDLQLVPGVKVLYKNVQITSQKGFGQFNLLAYHQRDYRFSKVKESWFIITNLSDPNQVIKLYKKRAGIEAMFRDYKSGGYNLEGSKANILRGFKSFIYS
jgi:hypothetical protein